MTDAPDAPGWWLVRFSRNWYELTHFNEYDISGRFFPKNVSYTAFDPAKIAAQEAREAVAVEALVQIEDRNRVIMRLREEDPEYPLTPCGKLRLEDGLRARAALAVLRSGKET